MAQQGNPEKSETVIHISGTESGSTNSSNQISSLAPGLGRAVLMDTEGKKGEAVPLTTTDGGLTGEPGSSDVEQFARTERQPNGTASPISLRKRGGPRTAKGKYRCKYNSVKHGILCKAVLLKDEDPAEFNSLLRALRTECRPVGVLEELKLEELLALVWRYRRLLVAEVAEIEKETEFIEWNEKRRQDDEALNIPDFRLNGGLVRKKANPLVLKTCLDLLERLRGAIEKDGFNEDRDKAILTKVYGCFSDDVGIETLFHSYLERLAASKSSSSIQAGAASPEDCENNFLNKLDEEIRTLRGFGKQQSVLQSIRLDLDARRNRVPDGARLDRLIKYENGLVRGIERVLNQLDRLQRARCGQPLPPTLNLNISSQ